MITFQSLIPGFDDPLSVIWWVLLAIKLVALADAVFRPRAVFIAADKLTKPGWVLILTVFTLSQVFQGWLSFFGLIGIVASAVYLVEEDLDLGEVADVDAAVRRAVVAAGCEV